MWIQKRFRATVAVGALSALALLTSCSTGKYVDLDDIFLRYPGEEWSLAANPVEITDEVCDDAFPCLQAYKTDQAQYFKFKTRDAAAQAVTEFGDDGYQSNFIAIHFTDTSLTSNERGQITEWLDSMHSSDG